MASSKAMEIPLSPQNFAKGFQFITTEKVADETQAWIRFMK
jgi:hypothetical protein